MWEYNQTSQELYHYGVLGMKWGVRRANRKLASNEKHEKKAAKYEKKAGKYTVKAEKRHRVHDLKTSSRITVKAVQYGKKSAKLKVKAVEAKDPMKALKYEKKSAKADMKSKKLGRKANVISRSTGYGRISMRYAMKSDKMLAKAAKAKYKITKNNLYAGTMQKKISKLSEQEIQNGKLFIQGLN